MKILVFGSGALGSLYAARLEEAGHEVAILARGQRLEDLREFGILLENAKTGEREQQSVNVVEQFTPDDNYDLVMVVMRKNHAMAILPELGANKKVPTFLFMMNDIAGPDELVAALGKDRVMRGFPYPGGRREDPVVKIVPADENRPWEIPIGEVDGSIRPRTQTVADALSDMRGFSVDIRTDMDAWLKYHFAVVGPAASALYSVGTDQDRLAKTRDALILCVRGIKEALHALRKAGYEPSPKGIQVLNYVPEPLFVLLLKWFLSIESLKPSIEGHAKAAPDEMAFLMDELLNLFQEQEIVTPVLDHLYTYYEDEVITIREGKKKIPMRWSGVLAAGFALMLLVTLLKKPCK